MVFEKQVAINHYKAILAAIECRLNSLYLPNKSMVEEKKKCTEPTRFALGFMLASQIVFPAAALAVDDQQEILQYLKNLSIEDLLQTEITSVSRKSEPLFTAAAAVTIITQEDIERTGARSIPEALRMVPGLAVSNLDASRYAIGARGFSDYFETKLLVLVDGRSMYTPLFSGVYWNSLDTIMQDIERIEVIRGPGATIWGANAVNGVINIITKNTADTQGGLFSASIGNFDQPDVSARFGGTVNDETTYRLYIKGYNRNNFDGLDDEEPYDSASSMRAGFRLDNEYSVGDIISLQGEIFDGEADAETGLSGYLTPPFVRIAGATETFDGGHIKGSWDHVFSAHSITTLQMYYDHTNRDSIIVEEVRDTIDFELKNQLSMWQNHDVVWGAGYRWTRDDITGSTTISIAPTSESDELWSSFIQDDINIIDNTAWVTAGTKLEHNDYTGFEIQPSIRFRVQPDPKQLVWAAVSRAVRTPSRSETDLSIDFGTRVGAQGDLSIQRVEGSENFDSETLIAYELGHRWQIRPSLSLDVTGFLNDYDQIRTVKRKNEIYYEVGETPVLAMLSEFDNEAEGESYGFEIQSTWQPIDSLKCIASYSYIDLELEYKSGSARAGQQLSSADYAPSHQFQLRNYWDIRPDLSLNSEFYYVSDLGDGTIDSYIRIDMQLSWQALDNVCFTLAGENLFGPSHQEFFYSRSSVIASEVPTIYWLKATYWF